MRRFSLNQFSNCNLISGLTRNFRSINRAIGSVNIRTTFAPPGYPRGVFGLIHRLTRIICPGRITVSFREVDLTRSNDGNVRIVKILFRVRRPFVRNLRTLFAKNLGGISGFTIFGRNNEILPSGNNVKSEAGI